MKKKLKTMCAVLLASFCSLPLMATNSQTVKQLVISKKDKTEVSFLLSETPVIAFPFISGDLSGYDTMIITTTTNRMEIDIIDLNQMAVIDVDNNSINPIGKNSDSKFIWQGDALLVDVFTDKSAIDIFSMDGRMILSQILYSGRHALSFSSIPNGVYIIKIDGKTIKISKR